MNWIQDTTDTFPPANLTIIHCVARSNGPRLHIMSKGFRLGSVWGLGWGTVWFHCWSLTFSSWRACVLKPIALISLFLWPCIMKLAFKCKSCQYELSLSSWTLVRSLWQVYSDKQIDKNRCPISRLILSVCKSFLDCSLWEGWEGWINASKIPKHFHLENMKGNKVSKQICKSPNVLIAQ